MISYLVSGAAIKSGILGTSMVASNSSDALHPLFTLNVHNVLSNNVALIGGLISGLILGIFKRDLAASICKYFDNFTTVFFKAIFPLMPIFISGTALKLQHDGILVEICQNWNIKSGLKPIFEGLLPFLSKVINAKGYKFYGTFHLGATYYLKNFDNMIVGK